MRIWHDEMGLLAGLRESVREPMFSLLLLCALAYLLLGNPMEAALLAVFVILLALLTLWQSVRTGRALKALGDLQVPLARIRVPTGARTIPAAHLKVGDVLVLSAGDRVAADARVTEGQLTVDESLLTGESTPVDKYPAIQVVDWQLGIAGGADDTKDRIRAGTFVINGGAQARVESVGEQTRAGRLLQTVQDTERRPSRLLASSRRLVRGIALFALVLVLLQFVVSHIWRGEALLHAVLESLTLGMASLPEEVPVIMTVFMAMGAWRMSRSQVLTRRLSAIEVLGSVTCVAIDKTGTLTENRMLLVAAQTDDGLHSSAELANPLVPAAVPATEPADGRVQPVPKIRLSELMRAARRASPAQSADPIDRCLRPLPSHVDMDSNRVADGPLMQLDLQANWPVLALVYSGADGGVELACKGAPECVFSLCGLNAADRAEWNGRLDAMAARGWRILAVATGAGPSLSALRDSHHGWTAARQVVRWKMAGLLAFYDPPRGSVRHAIAAMQKAGVRLLMLTGDHPVTASAMARSVGLTQGQTVLTGEQVAALPDEVLTQQLRTTDVLARMTAEQKLRVIACLQRDGQVVAMTGDGVNDTPALKAADVGVAMGRRACDLARETADLVLLDDDFGHMVSAIAQGRQIFVKMQQTLRFVVATHVPMLLLVLIPGFMNWPILLIPAHVVLFEILINPACSIVFEAQPPQRDIMNRPPLPAGTTPFDRAVIYSGLRLGAVLSVIVLSGLVFLWLQSESAVQQRNFVFVLLALFVLVIGLFSGDDEAWWRPSMQWWWLASLTGGLVVGCLSIPALSDLLELSWPSQSVWGLLLMATVAAAIVMKIRQTTSR